MGSADIASYVPSRVLELLPSTLLVPVARDLSAAVLVTDISGFTPLAERLVREGPRGVERLSAVLNGFYSELFERVYEHGGEVITIVGDGVISVWPALDQELETALAGASECGLRISRELHGHQPEGEATLSVRTGLGAGPTCVMRLGDAERWELVLLGDAVVQACGAERRAVPGTFAVSQAAWPMLAGVAHGRVIDESFMQVLDHRAPYVRQAPHVPAHLPGITAPHSAQEIEQLRRYLAPPVRTCLDAGSSRWLAELRHVTVAFLHMPTLDGNLARLPAVQVALSELQAAAHHFEGTFDKLVLDDKGLVATFIFGLPPHAHENDAERAVLAVLDAQGRLARREIASDIGVATGRVFWGPIGSHDRRQYCLVGSVMSLGARIMQRAQGSVLCCPETQAAVRRGVEWERAGSHALKGFESDIELHRPVVMRGSGLYSSIAQQSLRASAYVAERRCHGRLRERAQLVLAVERALRKEGGTLLIEADAGVGKSTLIEALQALAQQADARTLIAAGDPIEGSTPYHAFRDTLLGVLGLAHEDDAAARARSLTAHVEALPESAGLSGLSPLLATALGLAMADSPQTRSLEGQLRAERTHELVAAMIESMAADGLLLVLEDLHWLDSASLRLALVLRRKLPGISIVMTTRRVLGPTEDLTAVLERAEERIELTPLRESDTAALICERLAAERVSDEVVALVHGRSSGNPLFSESLALAMKRTGLLVLQNGQVVLAPNASWDEDRVPTSLDMVIGSRIDALQRPLELATLKAASVLGPVFELGLLASVHPDAPSRAALLESLALLGEHGLVAPSERDHLFAFDHVITQEVTYARLPLAQRRELHARAAAGIESSESSDGGRSWPRLAHHYERAHSWRSACDALDFAALEASRSGAYRESASFLDRALAILAREPESIAAGSPDPLREVRWHRMLGEARDALGHKEQMAHHARAALKRLGLTPPSTAVTRSLSIAKSVLHELAASALTNTRSKLSGGLLRKTLLVERSLSGPAAFEATRAAQTLAAHHFYSLEPMAMVQNVLLATRASELSASSGERAKCNSGVGLLLGLLGQHALARHYIDRALDACDEGREPEAAVRAWVMAAMYCVGAGDFGRASDIVRNAQRVAEQRNDHWSYCEAQAIHTWSHVYRGLYDRVPAEIQKLREHARRADHTQLMAWALRFEASQHMREGRYADASAGFREALPIVIARGDHPERLLVLGSLSLSLLREGFIDEARARSDEACAALEKQSRPTSHIMVHGVCDLLETLHGLDEHAHGSARAALAIQRRHVLKVLWQCSTSFRVASARYALFAGRAHALEGSPRRAQHSFERGLRAATQLALRHDRELLERAIAAQAAR